MSKRSVLPIRSSANSGLLSKGLMSQERWTEVTVELTHVIEWLFLAVLVILPVDIYFTLPGKSSGIFVSEALAAEACALLGVVLLLGHLKRIPEGMLLHLRDIWPLVILLGVSILAVVGAHSKSTGLRECGKYAFFLGMYAMARALTRAGVVRERIHIRALAAVLAGFALVLVCGFYLAVPGVPDIPGAVLNIQRLNAYLPYTNILRDASTFRFPDELNAYLLLILPLMAAFATKIPSIMERIFFGFMMVAGVWLLVLTYTRTGLLICLLAGPVLLYLLGKRRLAIAAICLGLLVLAVVIVHGGHTATRILSLFSLSNSGYTNRLEVWQWAWHAFAQHPLLGVGPRNLQFVPGGRLDVTQQRLDTNAENTYLNILADIGILGALAVGTVIVGALRRFRTALGTPTSWLGQAWHAGVAVGFLALLLDGTVHPTFYSPQVAGLLCALVGLMPVNTSSEEATAQSAKHFDQALRQWTEVIPSPIPVLPPDEMSAVERVPGLIVVISRLTKTNGIQYLIEALPRVLERHPNARLAIAGTGPYERSLRRQIQQLGMGHRAEFLGAAFDPSRLLREASLFVYPSVDPGETLPSIILDAFAAGTPVVASALASISNIVVDRQTGILCWPGDAASLADAIVTLLDDPARALEMGNAGHEIVRLHVTSESLDAKFPRLPSALETSPLETSPLETSPTTSTPPRAISEEESEEASDA